MIDLIDIAKEVSYKHFNETLVESCIFRFFNEKNRGRLLYLSQIKHFLSYYVTH